MSGFADNVELLYLNRRNLTELPDWKDSVTVSLLYAIRVLEGRLVEANRDIDNLVIEINNIKEELNL